MPALITGTDAKRARDALGLSQTTVASAIGVNRTYYSLFESGRYVLDDEQLQQLQDYLSDDAGESDDDPLSTTSQRTPSPLGRPSRQPPPRLRLSVPLLRKQTACAASPPRRPSAQL